MSCSTSGLTAFAFASEVLIRSCWMTSLQRLASSALRWAASRLSLWRVFWWRMAAGDPRCWGRAAGFLVVAQVQAARVQRLDDLVDRLLAEVRDRVELALGLRDEVAHGLDAGALEAVVRPDAELELLDEDVVHRRAAAGRAAPQGGAAAAGRAVLDARQSGGALAQLLDPLGV